MIKDHGIWFYAGIIKGEIAVSIECHSKYKSVLEGAVKKIFDNLKKMDENWENRYSDNERWENLNITMPIEALLNCDDQQMVIKQFVKQALEQLKQVKLVEAIEEELKKS